MRRTVRSSAAALAAALALAACGDDTTAPDTQVSATQQSVDLAVSSGDAVVADLAFVLGDLAMAGSLSSSSASAAASDPTMQVGGGCSYDASAGSWTCQTSRERDLDVTRTITFYGGGTTQQRYDRSTTDSIKVVATISGSFTRDGRSTTVSRTRNVTIGGLTGNETQRTVNGTGNGSVQSQYSDASVSRSYAQTVANAMQNVVLPVGPGYPISGTITHDVSATMTVSGPRSGTRTVQRTVSVTFNGTATVPMTVGTMQCTLNLDTRAVSCQR